MKKNSFSLTDAAAPDFEQDKLENFKTICYIKSVN